MYKTEKSFFGAYDYPSGQDTNDPVFQQTFCRSEDESSLWKPKERRAEFGKNSSGFSQQDLVVVVLVAV